MKKLIMILAVMMMSITAAVATPTDTQVQNFKNTLSNYIAEEGYKPSFDSDGDIKFKKEGSNYWVSVSGYDDGYYVSVVKWQDAEGVSRESLLNANNAAMAAYKYVRCYITKNDSLYIGYSWLCFNLADFKVMFENAMDVIDAAEDKIVEEL